MIQKIIKIMTDCAIDTSEEGVISSEYFEVIAKEIDDMYHDQPTSEDMFDLFWAEYHDHVDFSNAGFKPKTNKADAIKHWKKLSSRSKEKAITMIIPYAKSVKESIPCKARTYLSEKLFNDEYESEKKVVVTKRIATID